MPDKKISVDEILDELELERAKAGRKQPAGDMEHVDDLVRGILEKKQGEEYGDGKELTPRERQSLEKELKSQTRSLTKQLERLQKEKERERKRKAEEFALKLNGTPPDEPPAPAPEPEVRLNRVKKEQQVRMRPPEPLTPERMEEKRQKYDELKKAANSQHIRRQMEDITDHFGTNHLGREGEPPRPPISPTSYRQLKNNRNRRIEDFMKESAKRRAAGGDLAAQAAVSADEPEKLPVLEGQEALLREETEPVKKRRELDLDPDEYEEAEESAFGYEYTDRTQAGKVRVDLEKRLSGLKIRMTILAAVGMNALLFSFIGRTDAAVTVLGFLAVPPFLYALLSVLLLVGALAASSNLFHDISASFRDRRANKDILFLLTALVCLGVNIAFLLKPAMLLREDVHLYSAAAVWMLFFACTAKYQRASIALKNFHFLIGEGEKYGVIRVDDLKAARELTKGGLGEDPDLVKNVRADFLDGFLARSFHPDAADSFAGKMAWFSLLAGILLGAGAYFLQKDIWLSFTVLCGCAVLCAGFLPALSVSLPFFDASRFARGFAGMMPSPGGAEDFETANSVLVGGGELFPEDAVVMHGIKTFQGKRIDNAIVDAASVMTQAQSVLQHVFLNIIGNNRALLKPVDSIQYEDLMGISAWVDEKRVLIGNRDLMINHSVAVPKRSYEDKYHEQGYEVVYLASMGELCAAFIVEFAPTKRTVDAVRLLERYDMLAVVRSVDACLTADLLGRVFNVDPNHFKVLPARQHAEYDRQHAPLPALDAALGNNGAPLGEVVLLALSKKLLRCVHFGKLFCILSAVCGILLLAAAFLFGKLPLFGCWQVIAYLAAVLVLYWIYEKNMHL